MPDNNPVLTVAAALLNTIGDQEFAVIEFASEDAKWKLPEGTIAQHIDEAVKDLPFEVQGKTPTHVTLKKRIDIGIA